MFDFGRDLRRLFAQQQRAEDFGWLELLGVDLLVVEARQASAEAGRVSCARPVEAALKAAALWREHARRAGRMESLERAEAATADALLAAEDDNRKTAARLAAAANGLLRFDLVGGPERLNAIAQSLAELGEPKAAHLAVEGVTLHARLSVRLAMLIGDAKAGQDALALTDAAMQTLATTPECAPLAADLRLERAGLLLEIGLVQRDARLLDQAGRDLRDLVEASPAETRPLTRARALALCAAGLGALARLAREQAAADQALTMLEAATELFTVDHSPMDWAALLVARGDMARPASLAHLKAVERLTPDANVMTAALRERRIEQEVLAAERAGDLGALDKIEAGLRRRIGQRAAGDAEAPAAFDWVADQICLGHVAAARSRLLGRAAGDLRLALVEAAALAREEGAFGLSSRAQALLEPKS